jgi:hypothetical protein
LNTLYASAVRYITSYVFESSDVPTSMMVRRISDTGKGVMFKSFCSLAFCQMISLSCLSDYWMLHHSNAGINRRKRLSGKSLRISFNEFFTSSLLPESEAAVRCS